MSSNGLRYKPQLLAFEHARTLRGKQLRKYLRNTSSGYISKPEVKNYILNKYNNRCCFCGNPFNLQIDHIIPVYHATLDNIFMINSIDNLRLLCISCNTGRAVNG